MKAIPAGLIRGTIGALLAGSVTLALLARKNTLVEDQSREIARLKALATAPKPGKLWPSTRSATGSNPAERYRRAQADSEQRTKSLRAKYRALASKVTQLRDPAVRTQALEEMRVELSSSDPDRRLVALLAYLDGLGVDFDTSVFRALIVPLLTSTDADERAAALQAFTSLPREQGDLELIVHLGDDPSPMVRQQMFHTLRDLTNRNFTGIAAEAVLKLIDHPDAGGTRWGHLLTGRLAPELHHRLVELASASNVDEMLTVSAVDALNNQEQKDEAIVACLIDRLSDPQFSGYGGEILKSLRGPLPRELKVKVASVALQYIEGRPGDAYGCQQALYYLKFEGGPEHAEALTVMAAHPNTGTKLRDEILNTVAEMRGRFAPAVPAE